jgi:hypothetical protein
MLGFRFNDAVLDGKRTGILVAFASEGLEAGKEGFNALIGGII